MKSIVLFIICSTIKFFSLSQDTLNVYQFETGRWNQADKSWEWISPLKQVDLLFFKNNQVIYAQEKTYFIEQILINRKNQKSWISKDENGVECTISIAKKKGNSYFIVIYEDACLRYYFR